MSGRTRSYADRVDYAEIGEECRRVDWCQLRNGHGGDCDSRTERQRWTDFNQRLDAGAGEDT